MSNVPVTSTRLIRLLPAIFIRSKMETAGLTRSRLAQETGYTTAHFSKILSDNSRISPSFAYALGQILQFDPMELLTIQAHLDLKREAYIQMRLASGKEVDPNAEFDRLCLDILKTYDTFFTSAE